MTRVNGFKLRLRINTIGLAALGALALSSLTVSFSAYSAGEMRVCVDHYPPFQILGADAEPIGENISSLRLIAKLLDVQLTFVASPNFARCLHMLETGSADIVAGLIAKPERERYSYFLPYRPDSSYSFISQLSLPAITNYEELKQYSIGTSRDTQYFERFDQDKSLRKLVTNDVNVATNMLLKERFQVLIVPTTVLPSLRQRFPLFDQELKVHPYRFKEDRIIYFGLSKKHQLDLPIEQIESIFTKAYEQGLFMQEIDKFISEHIELY